MGRHPYLYSGLIVAGLLLGFFGFIFLVFQWISQGGAGYRSGWFAQGQVEVVKIEGPIFDSEAVLKNFDRIAQNPHIKAVVLRLDSPGGAVAPSQEIFEEVKKLRETKKVIVSMGTVAASGAYYIAAGADRIVASPGTITGSIGVIMENFGLEELIGWAHIKSRVLKSGEYKDVGSPFREMKPGEQAYLQQVIDDMYQQFTEAVSTARGLPVDKIPEFANGRIFTGRQALAMGLVDELGTLYDALAVAKKMAGLSDEAGVIWPHKNRELPFFIGETLLNPLKEMLQKSFYQMIHQPKFLYLLGPKEGDYGYE